MARIHQAVPRGASQGALLRVRPHEPKHRIPLSEGLRKLLGGRTTRELATLAGLSEAGLSRLLRGQRDAKGTTLRKVSKVLGCTMEQLLVAVTQGAERREGMEETRGLLARVRRGGLD